MEHECLIVIGDWAGIGHGQSDMFVYHANRPIDEQRRAFLASTDLTGLWLAKTDRVGFWLDHLCGTRQPDDPNAICTERGDDWINAYHIAILRRYGMDCSRLGNSDPCGFAPKPVDFAHLILRFISLSLPDFEWSELRHTNLREWLENPGNNASTPWRDLPQRVLNDGWKNRNLDGIFGYGIYGGASNDGLADKKQHDDSVDYARKLEAARIRHFRLTKNDARTHGRIVEEFPFEARGVKVPPSHESEAWWSFLARVHDFTEEAEGRVMLAGDRFFFDSLHDCVLFKLRWTTFNNPHE